MTLRWGLLRLLQNKRKIIFCEVTLVIWVQNGIKSSMEIDTYIDV